jgi:hypothetical protein
LCQNGGTFESEEKTIPLHEILVLRDLLLSRFPLEQSCGQAGL